MSYIAGMLSGIILSFVAICVLRLINKEDQADLLSGKKYKLHIESGNLWQQANVEFELTAGDNNETQ